MTEVLIRFKGDSLSHLNMITLRGGWSSSANTIEQSLRLMMVLQDFARCGFTEILIGDPRTGQQRQLLVKVIK